MNHYLEMEEIAKKLDGYEVGGRNLKCCPDVNAEQLVRMCNKQGNTRLD